MKGSAVGLTAKKRAELELVAKLTFDSMLAAEAKLSKLVERSAA